MCYRAPDTCNNLIRDNDLKEGHPVAGHLVPRPPLGGGEKKAMLPVSQLEGHCRRREANKAYVLTLCVQGTMNTVTFPGGIVVFLSLYHN